MTRSKRLLFTALLLLVPILAIEIFSGAALFLSYGQNPFTVSRTYREKLGMDLGNLSLNARLVDLWDFEEPHPYFGFTLTKRWAGVFGSYPPNNYGFRSRHDFPYRKKDNDFTIGIFGGSVARFFTEDMLTENFLANELKRAFPSLRDRNIVLLNFAMGGGKQPQQFAISSFFSDGLDLVLNIDGFNEAIFDASISFPPEFPVGSDLLFRDKLQILSFLSRIEILLNPYNAFSAAVASGALSHSPTVHLIWRSLSRIVEARLGATRAELDQFLKENAKVFRTTGSRETNFSIWKRFTWKQHLLLKGVGVPHLFFVQPSWAYKHASHPAETKRLPREDEYWSQIRKKYAELEKIVESERARGLPVINLMDMFREKEDVYADVRHLNYDGHKRLAKRIVQELYRARTLEPNLSRGSL